MPVFVDTNVFVYARDASETEKQPLADAWLKHLWQRREGRTSVQVLVEYYVTVTQKLDPGLPAKTARADVQNLTAWKPVPVDPPLIESAWRVQDRYGLSFWDSLVVAASKDQGCDQLLSEDLQPGQDLGGLVVVNPFQQQPAD